MDRERKREEQKERNRAEKERRKFVDARVSKERAKWASGNSELIT